MRVLWSGTERQSVAADSPSRVITLPAPPAHTPCRDVKEEQEEGNTEENKCVQKGLYTPGAWQINGKKM